MAEADTAGWDAVWATRTAQLSGGGSVLSALLVADGRDTPYGQVDEAEWVAFVQRCAARLALDQGGSVFEVGCGAGAFLYVLSRSGYAVSGIDRSPALVGSARQCMPEAHFEVADAAELPLTPPVEAVVSCETFMYFASADYARTVLSRMAAKATGAVAVLGVPDAAKKEEALDHRMRLAGGRRAYEARYRGLEHLYLERDWLAACFADCGLVDVEVDDQLLPGYDNAAFRFNCWGYLPDPARGR
jgi:SAM-dependent methyltransferase